MQNVQQLVRQMCTRDTVIGHVLAVRYNSIDWPSIDNEFVLRAKVRYELNELLSEADTFSYNSGGVVSLFERVIGSADFVMPNLSELVAAADSETVDGSFKYTEERTWEDRHRHCSIVGCWWYPVSRLIGEMLSRHLSQLSLVGTAYVCKKSVYLLADSDDCYESVLSILDKIDIEALKVATGARKLQVFNHRPEAMAVRIPVVDNTDELAVLVPETFTIDIEDESRVYVANLVEYLDDSRNLIGTYVTAQSVALIAADVEYNEAHRTHYGRNVVYAPTKVERNVKLFAKLIDEGFLSRSSWLNVL